MFAKPYLNFKKLMIFKRPGRGKLSIDFFRNSIGLLKLPFLTSLSQNFSTLCLHRLSKFVDKSAQKSSIFSIKASFERSLIRTIISTKTHYAKHLLYLFCLSQLFGCSSDSPSNFKETTLTQEIKGRDYEGVRFSVYRARIQENWIRHDPLENESLLDTKKPLCEFIIKEEGGVIKIAIHNFPVDNLENKIPPRAQVARWQRQFESIIPESVLITPQVFNGYSGLLFKGEGVINKTPLQVVAWALQISPRHFKTLLLADDVEKENLYKEMRADVTLKASGPIELMDKYYDRLVHFAHSFELIEEIPSSL